MAYQKQTWVDYPDLSSPITSERLNHMEDGIADAWEHGGGGAGETLPIGSELDFDGVAADIPDGWEQVDGSNLVAYTLYDNTSGALGTITLSDSAANYDYIEIFFRNNLYFYNSTKIYNPDRKLAILSLLYPEAQSSQIWIQGAVKSINATSISNATNRVGEAEVYSKAGYGATDRIYITKVVGYKEG